ncbi:hypothetical protein [Alloalcanivorax xenomutans]|uniref:hypothetical protein n=1 Tax=Alloalcanivorax xenomutans TaxID=1094342 RepID=UPI0007A741D6|nr:hypothetical protein [Alloalcanivorax xenomutans]ARB46956.1 hypothetical protein P40_17285 [Alloalcanivorax xenomutans]KYZ87808.1 hypothetical protein A3Q32_10620 [Alcanivorax sp. KX64203]
MRFKPSLEELLDEMSAAIAVHLGIEIGKASLDNSPWHNALNAIQEAVASKPAEHPMTLERALLHEAKRALTAIALCPRDDAEIEDLFERIDQAEVTACRIADFLFESSNPEAVRTQESTSQRLVQHDAYDVSEEQLVVLPRSAGEQQPESGGSEFLLGGQSAREEQDMPGLWSNSDIDGGLEVVRGGSEQVVSDSDGLLSGPFTVGQGDDGSWWVRRSADRDPAVPVANCFGLPDAERVAMAMNARHMAKITATLSPAEGKPPVTGRMLAGSPASEELPALAAEWEALAHQNAMAARNAANVAQQHDANVSANRAAVFTHCAEQLRGALATTPAGEAINAAPALNARKDHDLSALQRDADRYRWLRHDARVSAVTVGALRDKYRLRTLLAGDLDSVLDAARRRQAQHGGADHGA